MKNIIILIGVIVLFGCGNSTLKEKSFEFKAEDYQKVKVGFIGKEILIPNNYEEISPDELKEKLLEIKRETKFVSAVKEGIEKLKLMPTEFVIYADKDNYENCFWIQSGEFVDFDKNIASQYIGMLEEQIGKSWSKLGLNYERVESRFLKTRNSKIIKVKYRQEYNNEKKYQTQYILTSNYKTFGIVVSNYEDVDFEEIIKMI